MTANAEPALVQYWHSEEIPRHITKLIATFSERNPDLRHLVFNERTAAEFIAERFGARHVEAFRACAVPAMQADYLRYCAVHALGGVYADANFASAVALRPLLDTEGHLFEQLPQGPVLNGLFAFRRPGHPLLSMSIEIATRNIENQLCESVALTTGPAIFSGLVQLHRGGSLEALRQSTGARWKAELDSCWESLVDSFDRAIEIHGPLAGVFEGVRVSSRAEMLTWVRKPGYPRPTGGDDERHWAHWRGTIFRPAGSRMSP